MIPIVENDQISYIPYISGLPIPSDVKNEDNGKYGFIQFEDKVKYLNKMFKGQTLLKYIDIPSECEQIIESAFEGCENLLDITLPNTLKKIEDYAFKGCKKLTYIDLPESIEELEEGIFAECENIQRFDGKFSKYNGQAIVYNNKLISFSPKTYENYIYIKNIDENIKRLGKYCFYNCKSIRTIYIPSSVLAIGNYAFYNCSDLHDIVFDGNPPILGIGVFENINSKFTIHVPENRLDLYKKLFDGEVDVNKIKKREL
jgi:hypothetical protein